MERDAFGKFVLIYAVKVGHAPQLVGRSKLAHHIVRLHNEAIGDRQ